MRRPSVSVVIPCYNRADIVGNAIESALAQDYSPLEVVVADDGSSDDSLSVASRYGVNVVAHEHVGPPGIRNVGVAASSGEYIAFLDADDVWTEGSLPPRMEILADNEAVGLVFADARVVDTRTGALVGGYFEDRIELAEMEAEALGGDAHLAWSDPVPFLLRRSFVLTSTAIVSRRALDAVGEFDEELQFAEDLDMWLRIAERFPFAYTTMVAAHYCRHEDSMSLKRRFVAFGLVKLWTKLRARYAGRYPKQRRLLDSNLASCSYQAGLIAASERDRRLARKHFATAIGCMPTYKSAWMGYLRTILG